MSSVIFAAKIRQTLMHMSNVIFIGSYLLVQVLGPWTNEKELDDN